MGKGLLGDRGLGLEKVPLDVFEGFNRGLLTAQLPPQVVEDLIKCSNHMEAVHDVDSLREKALAHSVIGRPHVEADRLNLSTELWAKSLEMSNKRFLRAVGQHIKGNIPVQIRQHAAIAGFALPVGDGSGHPAHQCLAAARRRSGQADRAGR